MCRVAGPDQLQAKRQRSLSPRLVLNADLVPTKPPAAARGLCSPLRRWSKKCKDDEALVDLETLAKEGDDSGSEAATDASSATTSKSNTPQSSPARRRPSSPKVLLKALMSDDKAQQRARESQRRLLSFLFL